MNASYFGKTDIGRVSRNNEDNMIVQQIWDDRHLLMVVIDGVGGYEGGEMAAEVARDSIIKYLEDFPNGKCLELLKLAVVNANNDIVQYKQFIPKYEQMGCVLTAVLIELDNGTINVVHIGDTRLYQYNNGVLQKLTHDHSFVGSLEEAGTLTEEEAMRHPHRNCIRRFLGDTIHMLEDKKFVDATTFPIIPDSQLLLCSDGLYDMVPSAETFQILQLTATPDEKVQMLIDKANANGGKDNITVIVVEFNQQDQNKNDMMAASKKLSYLLRHSEFPDEQGWMSVEMLIRDFGYTEQGLRQIVENDAKRRYEFSEDGLKVRALYGHSNHVHIKWPEAIPPKILYHGTAQKNLNAILQEGLKSMSRQYVHLSETTEDAVNVGQRHGKPVVLAIDTQKVIEDGGCFYCVPNGIWLAEKIGSQYIAISPCYD